MPYWWGPSYYPAPTYIYYETPLVIAAPTESAVEEYAKNPREVDVEADMFDQDFNTNAPWYLKAIGAKEAYYNIRKGLYKHSFGALMRSLDARGRGLRTSTLRGLGDTEAIKGGLLAAGYIVLGIGAVNWVAEMIRAKKGRRGGRRRRR